jgi:WD40 repeat protein
VRLVDTRTGRELARARAGGPISALAVTSTRIALGALDGTLELRDAALAHPIALASPGAVTALAFSPDGTHLASAHGDGSTQLWDARTGRELARAPDTEPLEQPDDHDGHASLAFAPDGERLLAARPAGHTLVLDAHDLAPTGRLEGRLVGPIDRSRAAAAMVDGSVLVHDLARGTAAKLASHRFAVLAAAFSPDGARLATASIDGSVRIWDLATGATIVTIRAQNLGPATALAFAGDAVVTGYASGGVRVHPTTPAAALARACTILARFGRAAEVAPYCE